MVVGEMAHERDLVIIGGGPGGYHAAIRASQLGQKVTLIEKEELGGICLNKGCIPSKLLGAQAKKHREILSAGNMGFEISHLKINMEKQASNRKKVIDQLKKGIEALCQANKVELLKGSAYFLSADRIGVENGDSFEVYRFKNAIIAAGAKPALTPGISFDGKRIHNQWTVSFLDQIPAHLAVYGSDVNALEITASYRALGSEVTLLLDKGKNDFGFDSAISKELKRIFKKEKITILKDSEIQSTKTDQEGVILTYKSGSEERTLTCTHLFISSKNKPNTYDIGADRLGIAMNSAGFIQADRQCRTSMPNIYAIGDITEGPPLAIKAISQGKAAAEAIAGLSPEIDLRFMPKVVHTFPPIATVGLTEEEAAEQGLNIKIGQFPLMSNGYSALSGKTEGFIKVVSEFDTHLILGIHMIGEGALELISSGTIALEMAARDEDLTFPLYPHPSISEAVLEAAEMLNGKAIHIPPKPKSEKMKVKFL